METKVSSIFISTLLFCYFCETYLPNLLFYLKLQETGILKSATQPPLTLRLVVLIIATACGLYVCSICLEQLSIRTNTNVLDIKVANESCQPSGVEEWEFPYLHYPEPKTFVRCGCAEKMRLKPIFLQ